MEIIVLTSIFFALEGFIIGSFLNVVIDRLPLGKSLGGRSSCDSCGRTLSLGELVPVLSYALQGGKSKCCKEKLTIQYSLVETATGLSFFVVTYLYFIQVTSISARSLFGLIGLLVITSTSIAIALIDSRHHIIPDELQLSLFVGVIIYHLSLNSLHVMLVGQALIVALPILLLYLFTRGRGMGFGDVKMQMTLGLWLGLAQGFLGVYLGFLTGALYGGMLLALRKAGRKTQIAFGPFLLLGAWIAFVWGDSLIGLAKQVLRL
ncbi:prepilin peptidase [Candidatus Woesebacteria bacterium]|nr:prepilin peptidase [Candidatus Woesebacteria bacterium]